MKNCLNVTKITKTKNRINYNYKTTGKWKELINLDNKMFVEYDVDIERVPDSIAVIPLLCNILPISWVFDIEISVDELDKNFYECLNDIKKGYQDMYPSINMQGKLTVDKIVKNKYKADKAGAFFSGGVDAFNTLIQHIDEKPMLITVWGSDIAVDNENGWDIVSSHTKKTANDFKLEYAFIKANFRDFINYRNLTIYIKKFITGEWWHEFQHGIGLIGLAAPLAYINKFDNIYIASSFTIAEKGKVTCASDPTIDNYLQVATCKTIHDGYEFARQDKIRNIVKWRDNNKNNFIPLRVCWQSSGGKNCCECEKCYRTILGILAEKKDPNNFGFDFSLKKRKTMMKKVKKYVKYDKLRYGYIQNRFLENYSLLDTPKDLMWFRNIKIKEKKPLIIKIYQKICILPKRVIAKIKRALFK